MSKAKNFLNEAEWSDKPVVEQIVTVQVKVRVHGNGIDTSPEDAKEAAQKALMKIIPEDNIKSGKLSMYVISVQSTSSKAQNITFRSKKK